MSYDLVFWADPRTDRPDPHAIYVELLSGRTVDGLGSVDARGMLQALDEQFPGLATPDVEAGSTAWEGPDNTTVLEFGWSPQHVIVTARGRYTNDQINAVVDAGIDVGGGRLYDPQTGERFDGEG